MSSRSGRRSRSRSKSHDSRRSGRRDKDKPWMKKKRSQSSSSSSSSSRSRSSRRKNRRSRSRSRSPVRPVMSKEPKYVNSRVFVANVASDKVSSVDLSTLFQTHGKVVDALVHHNGYGFVQFADEDIARKAVKAETGTILHGKTLRCNMAAEKNNRGGGNGGGEDGERRGGPGPGFGSGRGRGGPGLPPPLEDRFGRDPTSNRDPYGPPPPPFGDPYLRGRDLPPPPRDYRDLGPPPFHREFLPPPRDMRGPRDLPPPPRDPYFDDPYRRPPPDPYYNRFHDDPYRRDPYRMDPYRDPYRDPFGPGLYDPVVAPKKPMAVDCDILIMTSDLRRYADVVEKRLKGTNLLTSVTVVGDHQTIQGAVEEAASRSSLFAIVLSQQNQAHHSLTLTILHGVTQEHRNMPLDDAVDLMARSFEKFLTAEKERLAAAQNSQDKPSSATTTTTTTATTPSATTPSTATSTSAGVVDGGREKGGSGGPPHPKDLGYLLNLLADNQALSVEELDRVIVYLQDRRHGLQRPADGKRPPPPPPHTTMDRSPGLQEPWPQHQAHYEQQQAPSYQPQSHQQSQHQAHYDPPQQQQSYQQQQQQPPQPQYQQAAQMTTQDLQSTIQKLMNGGASSTASTNNPSPQSTLTSHTTPLLPATVLAQPPPPPPPEPQHPLIQRSGAPPLGPSSLSQPLAASTAASSSSGPLGGGLMTPATLTLNFDNPTVQKALDNLIQSGPSLLKSISSASAARAQGQGLWPGQGPTLATPPQGGHQQGVDRPPPRSQY